jgi:choline dehydrogenase-like flavoprotein
MAFYDFPYGAYEHESSTHPIGAPGPLTITNDLELKELPGVYLLGPGNFVPPGAANPALTIMAMSRMLADKVRDRYL